MKKLFLFALLVVGAHAANAQTQRRVMLEAFSNASCPPCAAQNPAYNALTGQATNEDKIVRLKYQTNWPGVDPMNAQTQSYVGPRVSYYNVTGVPSGRMDGVSFNVGSLTQSQIDARYAVPSPLGMEVEHQFSTDGDSVYITVTVSGAQTVTLGSLRLHVALAERHIGFTSPPGTNGETEFHWVVRQTYPNSGGTVLNSDWTNGQDTVLTFAAPMPAYIYDIQEVAVVAFVQDFASKEVHQAGVSQPILLTTDGRVESITGLASLACDATVDATVEIRNDGVDPITSADIEVKIDGNLVSTFNWTGNLASGATTSQVITGIPTGSAGSHTLTATVLVPGDFNGYNNTSAFGFVVTSAAYATPFSEGFPTTPFPPADWSIINPDGGPTWNRIGVGGFMQGTGSTRMPFYLSSSGQIDYLYMPTVDLSQAGIHTSAQLKFSRAAARYLQNGQATGNDLVRFEASADCGNTWTEIWSRSGADLATVGGREDTYVPGSAADWRRDSASLAAFFGQTEVIIRYVGVSNNGNNAYFDDVNVEFFTPATIGTADGLLAGSVNLYPNPAQHSATLALTLNQSSTVAVSVINTLGQTVLTNTPGTLPAGAQRFSLNIEALPVGTYFVKVMAGGTLETRTLVVQ